MPPTKTVVAVHGIGEQISYETIQMVAYQFCRHFNVPPAIPLGRFDAALGAVPPATFTPFQIMRVPPDPDLPRHLTFAEVYWANVPRELVEQKYVLEESKQWAKTIAARVGVRAAPVATAAGVGTADPTSNLVLIQDVLNEMIDTIYVLEFLTGLAKRMGLFEFDLRKLLVDFLGDVQVVTEFARHREVILKKFSDLMDNVGIIADEIYIIAHSEGSVIAVLGLLQALASGPTPPSWAKRVRGLMTIGSPVEVHLLLWPELWDAIPMPASLSSAPIQWRNYLDSGDPIAYSLEKTREWLKHNRWNHYFEMEEYEFCRYPFPGKAHVDYWNDEYVFGHFIQNVMHEQPEPVGKKPRAYTHAPKNKFWAQILSYALSYVVLLAVLLTAVYVVYRPVFDVLTRPTQATTVVLEQTTRSERGVLVQNVALQQAQATVDPIDTAQQKNADARNPSQQIFWDVAGLTLLIGGLTVLVRLPRLAPALFWRIVAGVAFLGGGTLYWLIATETTRVALGRPFTFGWLLSLGISEVSAATGGIIVLAALVALGCAKLGTLFPHWGVRLLPMLGGAASVVLIGFLIGSNAADISLWPVVVGIVMFLYLWWLFALLFDLVFVWHRYIRHAAAIKVLREGYEVTTDG